MAPLSDGRTIWLHRGSVSVEGVAVTEIIATTEQLLAAWREAERDLDALDPFTPGRADVEARVAEARAAYQARVAGVEGDSTLEHAGWSGIPEVAEDG
jgi:hypothetical protein